MPENLPGYAVFILVVALCFWLTWRKLGRPRPDGPAEQPPSEIMSGGE